MANGKGAAGFQDHFSGHATEYREHRPRYPDALFQIIAAHAPGHAAVWDCGCGNGQASVGLARHFGTVYATDASARQIEAAEQHPRVVYSVAPAEHSGLPDASVDAVLVAQALHWFDVERFYDEVERVARRGALFLAVAYRLARISAEIDPIIERFHDVTLGAWWPADRAHIDTGYQGIPRRFPEVELPPVVMEAEWTLDQLLAYLGTWSSVQRMRTSLGIDPLPALREELLPVWGEPDTVRLVRWPLVMMAGRVG
ncbi:MAG TPA: class I SAM-dependent methyltransferase [Pedomonas sp.]|uniref:class I SAM-dependent methyltransferase n=1 Tax=Pedomonas sp. TaxID=2976421 RepID=UPI002F40DE17